MSRIIRYSYHFIAYFHFIFTTVIVIYFNPFIVYSAVYFYFCKSHQEELIAFIIKELSFSKKLKEFNLTTCK